MRTWALLMALGGCGGADPQDPPHDAERPIDTPDPDPVDTVADTDAVDTDEVDTDAVHTDLADTDAVDTETVDTDAIDTDEVDTGARDTDAVDTDTPPSVPPFDLGRGFVRLDPTLWITTPRDVYAGDRLARTEPDLTAGLFADLDGDGRPEVVIVGSSTPGTGDLSLLALRYDPATESLAAAPDLTARLTGLHPALLGLFDLDEDGHLDAISGSDRVPIGWGTADGGFEAQPPNAPYLRGAFTGEPVDLDQDGWTDLITQGDGGCQVPQLSIQLREDARALRATQALLGAGPCANIRALGVEQLGPRRFIIGVGVPPNTAQPFTGFWEQTGLTADGSPLFEPVDPLPADALFRLSPAVAGGPITLAAPMGVLVGDLDGVTTLMITTPREEQTQYAVDAAGQLTDVSLIRPAWFPNLLPDPASPGPVSRVKPWGGLIADLDRDGSQDLLVNSGGDPSDFFNALPGWNAPVLMLARPGAWLDASELAGVRAPIDGRALVAGDLDLDGRPDVILGGNGMLPQILLNRIDAGGYGPRHPIGLRLQGTDSGAWPGGARVRVFEGGVAGPELRLGAHNPGPISEPIVFGTTEDGVADEVEITWPDGFVQRVAHLAADTTHTIVEPAQLELTTRRAPAVGGVIHLRVTPRDATGAPRSATVEVSLFAGSATIQAPIADGLSWDVVIAAPQVAGSAVLEVRIDGVAMGVRPRLWWEE